MGTDIHPVLEVRRNGIWEPVKFPNRFFGKYDDETVFSYNFELAGNRNYDVFAILAGVRNGTGFAGIDTGDGFNPISEPRDFPTDIGEQTKEYFSEHGGDHSYSFVTLMELELYNWAQISVHRGYLSAYEFYKWDRAKEWKACPESWCVDISGGNIQKITNEEMRKHIEVLKKVKGKKFLEAADFPGDARFYTQIQWEEMYSEAAGDFYVKVIPVMRTYIPNGGTADDVRLVFNFDS